MPLLLLWSIRRHRSPSLEMHCETGIDALPPSIAGLSLGSLVQGNAVEVVRDHHFFDLVEQEVRSAHHSVHLENFLWKEGEVSVRTAAVLADAARRGIRVRVLLDAMGGRRMNAATRRQLRDAGCRLAFFYRWSLRNLGVLSDRDHRKLVISDGQRALVGGHCYTDAWLGEQNPTRELDAFDVSVRVSGPIVHSLQSAFSENWAGETGELFEGGGVFPTLPPTGDVAIHAAFSKPERSAPAVKILHHAAICIARRIWIQNPISFPSPRPSMRLALRWRVEWMCAC